MKPIEIANKISEISGIDLFNKSRKRNVIEHRGLLCYILREKLKMRWEKIAKFYKAQGWPLNHATLINFYNKWYMYKTNEDVISILNDFKFVEETQEEITKIDMLETKYTNLKNKLDDPLIKLVSRIPKEKKDLVKQKIDLMSKEW